MFLNLCHRYSIGAISTLIFLLFSVVVVVGSVGLVHAETLANYAKVKTAICTYQCSRGSLRLRVPIEMIPTQGVVIVSGGLLSQGGYWRIVDFGKKTPTVLETVTIYDRNGPTNDERVDRKRETTITEEQLSHAIDMANRIWNPTPPAPPRPGDPQVCLHGQNNFILLDRDASMSTLSTCGFTLDKYTLYEGTFEEWFDSVLPVLPRKPNGG